MADAPGIWIDSEHSPSADSGPFEGEDPQLPKQPVFVCVVDGLTFDLTIESFSNRMLKRSYMRHSGTESSLGSHENTVVRIAPGPHLSGAERSLPVVRAQTRVAMEIARMLPGIKAIAWPLSAVTMDRELFCAGAEAWLAGGSVSASGLITYDRAIGNALQSRGLAYFSGQELRIEGDLANDHDEAVRLAARLTDRLIRGGALTEVEYVTGPTGATLQLEPSRNGRFVRVWLR